MLNNKESKILIFPVNIQCTEILREIDVFRAPENKKKGFLEVGLWFCNQKISTTDWAEN